MFLLKKDIEEIVESTQDFSDAFAGKNILITGGRGFLGRYFCEYFNFLNKKLSTPCYVIAVDNFITSGENGKIIKNTNYVNFIQADITEELPDLGIKFDYILHAAGIASPEHYKKHPVETIEVVTLGLKNMLELAQKHNSKLTFFSSSEIYGNPDVGHIPTKEDYKGYVSCTGPRSMYDESKRLGEAMVFAYSHQYGIDANTIRPFNVYGPGMQKTDYRVLPNFAAAIKDGKEINIYGNGRQTRTFCYVTDAINGFLRVMVLGHSREAYNIGNPYPEISMKDLFTAVCDVTGKKLKSNVIPHPPSYPADEPDRRCPDITKAISHLQYLPKVNLKEGLFRFFSWAEDNF